MENANTFSIAMTKTHALQKNASMDNAKALQSAVMTAMLAQPILAILILDARTLQSLVTTTIHAPRTLAILILDAFTLLSTVMTKILALSILALMETVFIPKKAALIAMHAQPKLVMSPMETVFTLLYLSRTQTLAPSELAMQSKELSILQSIVRMEINAQLTIAMLKKDANVSKSSFLPIVLEKPQDAKVTQCV